MNTAIIVAAGTSQRFASPIPKQFIPVLGRPLILHTLEQFDSCKTIDEIVLVLSGEGREEFARINGDATISKRIFAVTGGKTRAESVRNGLDKVNASTAGIIAVHDGARPLVSIDEITGTVEKAAETGAACLVSEVTDTIKHIDGDYISHTIDRSRLVRALTPQAFRYDILRNAFAGVDLSETITDECYLVEQLGIKVAFVKGNARNIKITRPEDILVAEALIAANVKTIRE